LVYAQFNEINNRAKRRALAGACNVGLGRSGWFTALWCRELCDVDVRWRLMAT